MKDGDDFELPTAEGTEAFAEADLFAVDAFDIQVTDERAHGIVEFFRADVPELDGQCAAMGSEEAGADVGVGEVAGSAGADDDTAAGVGTGGFRNVIEELGGTRGGIEHVDALLIERV